MKSKLELASGVEFVSEGGVEHATLKLEGSPPIILDKKFLYALEKWAKDAASSAHCSELAKSSQKK